MPTRHTAFGAIVDSRPYLLTSDPRPPLPLFSWEWPHRETHPLAHSTTRRPIYYSSLILRRLQWDSSNSTWPQKRVSQDGGHHLSVEKTHCYVHCHNLWNVMFCKVGQGVQSDEVRGVLAFFVLRWCCWLQLNIEDVTARMMIMATNIEVVRSQKSVSSEEKLGGFLR